MGARRQVIISLTNTVHRRSLSVRGGNSEFKKKAVDRGRGSWIHSQQCAIVSIAVYLNTHTIYHNVTLVAAGTGAAPGPAGVRQGHPDRAPAQAIRPSRHFVWRYPAAPYQGRHRDRHAGIVDYRPRQARARRHHDQSRGIRTGPATLADSGELVAAGRVPAHARPSRNARLARARASTGGPELCRRTGRARTRDPGPDSKQARACAVRQALQPDLQPAKSCRPRRRHGRAAHAPGRRRPGRVPQTATRIPRQHPAAGRVLQE